MNTQQLLYPKGGTKSPLVSFLFLIPLIFFNSFTISAQTTIVCANGPVNDTFCYDDNNTIVLEFQSDSGFPLILTFNEGTVENSFDELVVLDSDGVTDLNAATPYGNGGDVSGLTFTSSGDSISFTVTSDGSINCAAGDQVPLDFDVLCASCINPSATYTVVEDCVNTSDFTVDVDITDFGTASSVTVSDDQGSPTQSVATPGIVTMGPYPQLTDIIISIDSDDDPNCSISSEPLSAFCLEEGGCSILNAGEDTTIDCGEECITLEAGVIAIPEVDTSSYTINGPICDLPPIDGGTPTNLVIDDTWSSIIDIGFDFSFFGNEYSQMVVAANGQISFDLSLADDFNGWSIDPEDLIPVADDSFPLNTIYGAFHDLNPAVNPDPARINYFVTGDAPFRIFVLNYNTVPHFGGACQDTFFTSQQILLYESLNVIDVNLINKPTCPDWNDGLAVVGIMGNNLSEFSVPPTRNTGVWEAQNENWRFVPSGNPSTTATIEWQDESGTVIANTLEVEVCPTEETTYTAILTYDAPGGTQVFTDDITITPSDADFSLELGDDRAFCDTPSFEIVPELEGDTTGATYLWSNGETTPTITVSTSDTYSVDVTVGNCTQTDSIAVTFLVSPDCVIDPECSSIDFEENFGTGTGRVCDLGTATTTYVCNDATQVEDGQYSITNTSNGLNTGWHLDMEDHTEGDVDGRALFVNADFAVGEFYRRTIALDEDTDYAFSAWITTVYDTDTGICGGSSIPSNVIFRIEDPGGTLIAETNTGDIPNGPEPDWQEFFINFNTGANTDIQLVLINNAPGGCGNDLAIDDITLTLESSPPTIVEPDDITLCEEDTGGAIFDLTSVIDTVLDGQDASDFDISFHIDQLEAEVGINPIATPDAYANVENPETIWVRVSNAGETLCFSTVSFDLIVDLIVDFQIDWQSSFVLCSTDDLPTLDATPQNPDIDLATVTYEWTDSGGTVVSTDAMYTPTAGGSYEVVVTSLPCSSETLTASVLVTEAPILDLGPDEVLCDGGIFEIIPEITGSTDEISFAWSTGETTPTIVVDASGTYTLEITSGPCVVSNSIEIFISDPITVDVTPDFKTCPEEPRILTATASDAEATYQWFLNGDILTGETASTLEFTIPSGTMGTQIYSVVATKGDCTGENEVAVTLYDVGNCVISQGISPNGSPGFNDALDLEFLSDRTGGITNLQIFNRLGALVFERSNYIKEWIGQDKNGNELPTGTYFYVIDFLNEDPVYGPQATGWIYLNKER
ncbi:MAG: gliding motility-associated C-terminal domain-containing protein [Flavobacteriaceae bacterium]|nr:gliding motility-associated C-terminal domain-containing protein [Flavobacteriaceae bacterium]